MADIVLPKVFKALLGEFELQLANEVLKRPRELGPEDDRFFLELEKTLSTGKSLFERKILQSLFLSVRCQVAFQENKTTLAIELLTDLQNVGFGTVHYKYSVFCSGAEHFLNCGQYEQSRRMLKELLAEIETTLSDQAGMKEQIEMLLLRVDREATQK